MVNHTPRFTLCHYSMLIPLLLFTLFCTNTAYARQAQLTAQVATEQIELGKAFKLILSSNKLDISIKQIDLSVLKQDFEVQDHDHYRADEKQQQWTLRLYPRRTGQLTIPPLSLADMTSNPVNVQVHQAVDIKTGKAFTVTSHISTSSPWLRQQVSLSYTFESAQERMVLETADESYDNFIVKQQAVISKKINDHTYQHTAGWLLFPLSKGQQQITLPPLNYIRDGVVTHRFYPAPVTLEVRPLPHYLPGHIPVGHISLGSYVTNQPLLFTDRLNDATLTVTTNGIPPNLIPDLEHHIQSSQQVRFYPANKTAKESIGATGLTSQTDYTIPFKTMVQGRLGLPVIQLHYFDPVNGTLKTTQTNVKTIFSMQSWLAILLALLTLLLVIFLLRKTVQWFKPVLSCYLGYRAVLTQLHTINNAQDLKDNLMALAQAEGLSPNLTLIQWQNHVGQRVPPSSSVDTHQLHLRLYRGDEIDIDTLRQQIRQFCLSRWPFLKWSKAS